MKQKIHRAAIFILIFTFTLLIIEVCLRIVGFSPYTGYNHNSKPNNFIEYSDILGWKLKKNNCFKTFIDNKYSFSHCTDSNGNRKINFEHIKSANILSMDVIHLYGCSYTFGYSVSDKENMSYFLQQLMPTKQIVNKGVPGYGLFQMYSSLVHDIKIGKKPSIAIFNYASFHDGRTPLVDAYARDISSTLKFDLLKNKGCYLKFPDIKSGKIITKKIKFCDLSKHIIFREKSALVNVINTKLDQTQYSKIHHRLQKISFLVACQIQKTCIKHNISLIFVGIDKKSNELLKKVSKLGCKVVYFPIDISNPANNCSPIDSFHPNAKIHKLYAETLFKVLRKISIK